MKSKKTSEMNEETFKNRIIVPFLDSIGYHAEQLSFEDNFTLKLGKNTIKKKDYISGRLDILVLLDNEPFIIWELKREKHEITSEEINQAISYSRLTEQITPFTIVSNGDETHIYNTITKKEIKKDELNPDLVNYSFDEAIKLKKEALADIICYSNDNLTKFINRINNRELDRLRDNKYIKELYVERKNIHDKFNEFLNNDKKIFFINGNSGIGKTNIICNLVESNMNNNTILFYNSCFIEKSILNSLLEDFNFAFDEQLYYRQLFNRINLLSKKNNKYFIICIDAIDELAIQNPTVSIDKFLDLVNEFSNIKVCLSCKKSYINDYLEVNGVSSALKNISKENVNITEFSSEEKDKIIDNYKKYFNVEINDSQCTKLKEMTSDGFLFRIIFETFKNSKIDTNIDNISVIQKYIERIASNYNLNKYDLIKTLEIIGLIFIRSKDNFFEPIIEEQVVDNELRINNSNISIDTLIKCNVLQLYKNNDINYIDFDFKALSYYVITILSAKLNILKKEQLVSKLFELNENRRCKEALSWFSKNSNENYYIEINQFKKEYGKKLMANYRKIVNENFPNIKDKFEINEDINNVGIAIDHNNDFAVYTYGFYKKENNDLDVKIINFNDKQTLIKLNINTIHTSMVAININNIIKDRLKSIIKYRELNENNCRNLNIERIIINLFVYGKALKLNYKYERKNFIPNLNEFFPLNLVEMRKKILIFNINLLKQIGIIPKDENEEELYQKQIIGEISIPQCNYIYSGRSQLPIYNIANLITNYMLHYSENIISSPYLLLPSKIEENRKSSWVNDIMIESFSKDELHNYLYDIFDKCIDEYLSLVEENFPTLKDNLKYYNLFKNGVNVKMYLYKTSSTFLGNYSTKLWYCYSESGKKVIEITFCDEKDVPKEINEKWITNISGGTDIYFFNNYHSNENNKYLVLSNFIYNLIDSDLKDFLSNEVNNL